MELRQVILKSLLGMCLLAMVSCGSNKQQLAYFMNIDSLKYTVNADPKAYGIKIIPDDELIKNVSSLIPEATSAYNAPLANVGGRTVSTSEVTAATSKASLAATGTAVMQTYIVDKKGDIIMPVLGRIHVEGLTAEEIASKIRSEVSKTVEDPFVRVQLLNYRINVLGEVQKPGAISVTRERYSILDALADAQDLTEFGRRDQVLLVREENGKRVAHPLNLNDARILESPYFYLQQNDVVYVEPNQVKESNSRYNQHNAYKLTVVSTIVSAASVIASLVIALTVK